MKYVIINGSPRLKNTWKIITQTKTNLKGEFDEVHLIKENIPLCIGCFKCIMEGEEKCPHYDKINPIVEKIRNCDGLIIASPVYAMNVTAILKNFLDHTAYLYHRPEFFTKKGLVIVSTAGAGHKKVGKYIEETIRHWGVNKVYKITMACGGIDSLETSEIDKTAKKFCNDLKSKKLHSPKFSDIIYYDVWKAMAFSKNPIKADKDYWFDNDLINYDFAPEVKLNIIKKVFSKIMFFILRHFIK